MRHLAVMILIAFSLGSLLAEESPKPTEWGDNFAYYEKTTPVEITKDLVPSELFPAVLVAEFPSIPTGGYNSIRVMVRIDGLPKDYQPQNVGSPSLQIEIRSISGGGSTLYASLPVGMSNQENNASLEASVAGTKTRVLIRGYGYPRGKYTSTASVYLLK